MTPNWAAAAPYTVTARQAEVDSVCAMGGDLTRFWMSESDLSSDYEARVDQVMARAAACRIRVIMNVYDAHAVAPVQDRFLLDVAHLLSRYPGLCALEVWNQPNNPLFLSGTPTSTRRWSTRPWRPSGWSAAAPRSSPGPWRAGTGTT
jgi:hypothetical protein